ncbi:enhancer of polycomb-like-domain-containing protein [Fimicolochytrium jonesii]|uniref:enhancer of polycomb-like-domain-containing protein n=1 Tax=Fimicolochytrium jonesii TaxID=1396493 RepID=UPI0022FE6FA7|nr:enhancer of polycomb-like-domain-containing protein [Fimicolochytrium jonesii]KAI8824200.1 enhancer of polycomb-like-domain-containing protein [Fimicolochytrium jonesii]
MVSEPLSGLRSRTSVKKAMPVWRYHEVPDLDESASLSRALLQVATGVEKEEEEEHHLQAALIASHQPGHKREQVIIPTPDASRLIPDYSKYYSSNYEQPSTTIRFSATLENVIGIPYNLDDVDYEFLAEYRSKIESGAISADDAITDEEFELIMYFFELAGDDKVSGEPPSLDECRGFFEGRKFDLLARWGAISHIYPHWRRRRYVLRGGTSIQPKLKLSADWLGKADDDPYVCFRRREVKSVRKARGARADSVSLDKLRRLRDEMDRAKQILELITNREAARKESIVLEHLIFEQRVLVRRLKKKLGIVTSEKETDLSPDMRRRKKRSEDGRDDVVKKIRIPAGTLRNAAHVISAIESKLHEAAADVESATAEGRARRKKMLEESQGWIDITEYPYFPPPKAVATQCWRSSVPGARVLWDDQLEEEGDVDLTVPYGRQRVGRGGRLFLDRHVKQRVWLRRHGGKIMPIPSPSSSRSKRHSRSGDFMHDLSSGTQRWRFDTSDDEVEEPIVEMEETADQLAYRVFTVGPKTEEEIFSLMGKPAHPDQATPRPSTAAQRAEEAQVAPPQVVRPQNAAHLAALGANGLKKRPSKPSEPPPKLPPAVAAAQKRRAPDGSDPKAVIIKAMMQQAQRQAQQQQQQFQQLQAQQQSGTPQPQTQQSVPSVPIPTGPRTSISIQSSSPAPAPSTGTPAPTSPQPQRPGPPATQPAVPQPVMPLNVTASSPARGHASYIPAANSGVQAQTSTPSQALMAASAAQQPPQAMSSLSATAMNNAYRQQQARQVTPNQIQLLRQQQQQQQLNIMRQQQQQGHQVSQQQTSQPPQMGYTQFSQPPQQSSPTSLPPNSASGLASPSANNISAQQLLYYQQLNSPATQLAVQQQQMRVQAALQMPRLNQATLAGLANGTISTAQLQAYLAQQQQQQQTQQQLLQHGSTPANLALQQHLMNQQKAKAAGMPAASGVTTPVLNGSLAGSYNGSPYSTAASSVALAEIPASLPLSNGIPTSAQMLTSTMQQQFQAMQSLQSQTPQQLYASNPQLMQQAQAQLLSRQLQGSHHHVANMQQALAQSPMQLSSQQQRPTANGTPTPSNAASPAMSTATPTINTTPLPTGGATDTGSSDKENGPGPAMVGTEHSAMSMSPHIPTTQKTAA